jgi:hypothetical protein
MMLFTKILKEIQDENKEEELEIININEDKENNIDG